MTIRADDATTFDNGTKGFGVNATTGAIEPALDAGTDIGVTGAAAAAKRFGTMLAKLIELQSNAGVRARFVIMEEEITLATDALTTDSSANLLLANAIVLPLFNEVTTTVTTSTNWAVGVSGTAAKFLAATTDLTAGTTKVGAAHWAGTVAIFNSADAKVRITVTGANAGAGKIRVSVPQIVIEKAS